MKNESEVESDKATSSENPQFNHHHHHHHLEEEEDEEEEVEAEALTTLAHFANPNPSIITGKRKRKPTTHMKEFFLKNISEPNTATAKQPSSSSPAPRKYKSHKKKYKKGDEKPTLLQPKSPALIRAKELQLNLEPQFPSFTKTMVRSHIASCFWMGLPGPFAKTHLPHVVTTVTLEAENGALFDVKYIGYKTGLSQGWRQFVVAQNLLEGDVLIFQLTRPRRFKVYIVRAHDLAELDGVLGLLNLEAQIKQNDAETSSASRKSTKKTPKSLPLAVVQKEFQKSSGKQISTSESKQAAEQSENDSEVVGSEVLEGYKLPTPTFQFNDVKSFNDFGILVDGSPIGSEFQENIRKKYYDLCCSQKTFLHENIIPGLNFKLIVGIISETVNIADNLSNCKLTTSLDEFSGWENSLKAFELLGMNVGFLLARLKKLVKLSFESEGGSCTRRYAEAKIEKSRAEEELKGLEAKVEELKKVSGKCEAEIESLKPKAVGYEVKFQKEVAAPW
ncbi:hypothetical protein ACFE04_022534 [Oxalis oulophora]